MGAADFMKMLMDPDLPEKMNRIGDKLERYAVMIELIAERQDITQKEIDERIELKREVANAKMSKVRRENPE